MSDHFRFKVSLDSTITVSDASPDELPLRRFNIVILVEPDMEWFFPNNTSFSIAASIWNEVKEELLNFTDDPEDVFVAAGGRATEVDIILARIGSAHYEVFSEVRDQAYITFPQGIIQPYMDVLRHLKYWLTGVHKDFPAWRAVVIGGTLEQDVAHVANAVAECGITTTILKRYCLREEFFVRKPDHDELPKSSYGEITADKLTDIEPPSNS